MTKNVTIDSQLMNKLQKMTSRQQILVYLAACLLNKVDKKTFSLEENREQIAEITGLSDITIDKATYFLFLDGHLGEYLV